MTGVEYLGLADFLLVAEAVLEEGGGARNRLDTLARVAIALDRHLVVSFPDKVPATLKDAVEVA